MPFCDELLPLVVVAVGRECGLDRPAQAGGVVVFEDETGAGAGARVPGLHGVGEPAGAVHDGHRAVAQAVELVEAAGLVARRHEEHVGARLDQVGEVVVEAAVETDLAREGALQAAEHVLEPRLAAAEHHQLKARGGATDRASTDRTRSKPFWPTSRETMPSTGTPGGRAGPGSPAGPACSHSLPVRSPALKWCGNVAIGLGRPLVVVDAVEDADHGRSSARAETDRGRRRGPRSGFRCA